MKSFLATFTDIWQFFWSLCPILSNLNCSISGRSRRTFPDGVLDRVGRGHRALPHHHHDRRLSARAALQANARETSATTQQLWRELERRQRQQLHRRRPDGGPEERIRRGRSGQCGRLCLVCHSGHDKVEERRMQQHWNHRHAGQSSVNLLFPESKVSIGYSHWHY